MTGPGSSWLYSPTKHMNVNRGKDRTIPLGHNAQEVLKPWLRADPDASLFSPKEASVRFDEASRKPRPGSQEAISTEARAEAEEGSPADAGGLVHQEAHSCRETLDSTET